MKGTNKEILPDISNIKSHETYTLPSKGLVYKPEDNIPASITLRRMTTKEDKIRMRNNSDEQKIRKDILQACICNENIDAGKLKINDANFLLFRLRSLSLLDDIYKVHCICNKCKAEFIHEIKLSEVPINYCNQKQLKDYSITLPISKTQVELKLPCLNDLILMNEKLREYFEINPEADLGEVIYSVSSIFFIDTVNNHKLLTEELEKWIEELDILDNRFLRDAINKIENNFGLENKLPTVCPTCGKEIIHGLPITGELFNPSR